jgi:hypothetical protein
VPDAVMARYLIQDHRFLDSFLTLLGATLHRRHQAGLRLITKWYGSRREVPHGLGLPLARGGAGAFGNGRRVLDRPGIRSPPAYSRSSARRRGTSPSPRFCPIQRITPAHCRLGLYAGSLVFRPPAHQVDLRDWGQWWTFRKGADWRHSHGPNSNISGLDNHPVVHVAFSDALAYAR